MSAARKILPVGTECSGLLHFPRAADRRAHGPASKRSAGQRAVEGVSWADAVAYCRWLTVGTGRIYRLPDEREWEKAARKDGTLEDLGPLREWTNSWQDGGRVLRTGTDPSARVFLTDDLARVGFRVVHGMTGR